MNNGTMMQYFQWYLPQNCYLWRKVGREAKKLKEVGITALWLPPAYKGNDGASDVGYSVYDLYDLGEFKQKGSVATKYGTKEEYIKAIKTLKENGIDTYVDISLDHKIGADDYEKVLAFEYDCMDRNKQIGERITISAWTKFTFPGRKGKYSDFKWDWTHFDGVDWDERSKRKSIFRFDSKEWDKGVGSEYGNYDYLMGADLQLSNEEVVEELNNWGKWYLNTTDFDGIRLDAAKHTSYEFIVDWISMLRKSSGKELFTVAEYWNPDINVLEDYISATKGMISLFDIALHYHFFDASKSHGNYDMRNIFKNTLVEKDPIRAVTFVDNHDTQIGQSLESWIEPWFKPLAYSLILLRAEGYPCIFYGDYYGVLYHDSQPMKKFLDNVLKVRRDFAYGNQKDYFDNYNIIGWIREGDDEHVNSGIAVLMSNAAGGSKEMSMGERFANKIFYDITKNIKEKVKLDKRGVGNFLVNNNSVSIWIEK